MPFVMQQMRRVCEEFADGTAGFVPHLEAVEDAAEKAPFTSAERAKALLEICCKTIAEERGLPRAKADLNELVSVLIKQIPFAGLNHPDDQARQDPADVRIPRPLRTQPCQPRRAGGRYRGAGQRFRRSALRRHRVQGRGQLYRSSRRHLRSGGARRDRNLTAAAASRYPAW